MTRQHFGNVIVSLEAGNCLGSTGTRPLEPLRATLETGGVTAVQQDDHRKWTTGQARWVVNGSTQLHGPGKVTWLKSRVAEVVFFARNGKRAGCARIGCLRERRSRSKHDER